MEHLFVLCQLPDENQLCNGPHGNRTSNHTAVLVNHQHRLSLVCLPWLVSSLHVDTASAKQHVCSSWAELEPGQASLRALPPSHVNKLLQCILADTLMSPADLVSLTLLLSLTLKYFIDLANSQQWSETLPPTGAMTADSCQNSKGWVYLMV